jgi:hypothetical protein
MIVVTDKGFFITIHAAKAWKKVAEFFTVPDGFSRGYDKNTICKFFSWDPAHNILHASTSVGSVYRLRFR